MSPAKAMIGYLQERVLQLEAENRRIRDNSVALSYHRESVDAWKARAEKAEAEIERLQAYRRLDSLSLSWDDFVQVVRAIDCSDVPTAYLVWIEIEGGGRESDTDRKMKPSGDGVTPSRDVGPSGSKEPLSTGSVAAQPRAAERPANPAAHDPPPFHALPTRVASPLRPSGILPANERLPGERDMTEQEMKVGPELLDSLLKKAAARKERDDG